MCLARIASFNLIVTFLFDIMSGIIAFLIIYLLFEVYLALVSYSDITIEESICHRTVEEGSK